MAAGYHLLNPNHLSVWLIICRCSWGGVKVDGYLARRLFTKHRLQPAISRTMASQAMLPDLCKADHVI